MSVKIVAELGCNHLGSLEIAKSMIAEAKACGCDYVKFQKRHLGSIPKERAERPYISEHSFGKTYLDHRAALEFDGMQWKELQSHAERVGIGFFGTAFDLESAEFLSNLSLPYLKIGSGQARDLAFLSAVKVIKNRPPIILSIGMCDCNDVRKAIQALNDWVEIIVHTTSSYPCPENEINLRVLDSRISFQEQYRFFHWGLSGHYSAGNGAIEAAAVALGAVYIERHFTLDRTWKGTDQAASLEPVGMVNVVKAVRIVERALGDGIKRVMPSELPVLEKLKAHE
jgi:sialic acid synthase SpsE